MSAVRGQLVRALADSLRSAQIPATDRGGVQLARRYAQLLDAAKGTEDEVDVFDSLGPKYLAALTALGLTTAGRAKVKGGVPGGGSVRSKLDELRERRQLQRGGAGAD